MKIVMMKTAASDAGVFMEGKTYETDAATAEMWIRRGAAVAVDAAGKIETAAAEPVAERAVRRGRPKKAE